MCSPKHVFATKCVTSLALSEAASFLNDRRDKVENGWKRMRVWFTENGVSQAVPGNYGAAVIPTDRRVPLLSGNGNTFTRMLEWCSNSHR